MIEKIAYSNKVTKENIKNKVIFWDFQGTLAYNNWMVSKALYKVIINNEPNTNLEIDDFKKKVIKLSNHIPELPDVVEELGLSTYLVDCISSANVGYEKPNAKIYEYALEKHNMPEEVWMIGDSIEADVRGPENAGINSILVRSEKVDGIRYYSNDLVGLRNIIK